MAEEGRCRCGVQYGVTMITRSGRGEGATTPGPCCRSPLSIIMCGALCVWRRPATGRTMSDQVDGQSVASVRLWRFCRRPSFAAPSSSSSS